MKKENDDCINDSTAEEKRKLRDKFFKECVDEFEGGFPRKINFTPHDMFEWIWQRLKDSNDVILHLKETCDGYERELRRSQEENARLEKENKKLDHLLGIAKMRNDTKEEENAALRSVLNEAEELLSEEATNAVNYNEVMTKIRNTKK